jgi:aminoglycoside phosphotransferase (APT) family kinase protein
MWLELNIEDPRQLALYLRRAGRVRLDEEIEVSVLPGGVSNRTVLVRRADGSAWVLKQALSKLRVAVDWFSPPERIQREALGLRWLSVLAPHGAVPALVFEDRVHHVLAMEAVPQPHENWKTRLLAGGLDEALVKEFARLLAAIHRHAWERRDTLAAVFEDRSFFESLRLEPYYGYAATQVPAAKDFLHRLITETRARRQTLVHGDFSPKNILVHAGRLVLLDHEVIHWGDPAFDLGFALTHLLSKAHHVRARRDAFAGAAQTFWEEYRGGVGDAPWTIDLESHAVRQALGCLLARVAGRSPLEYLTDRERAAQRAAVLELIAAPPNTVAGLAPRFLACLPSDA